MSESKITSALPENSSASLADRIIRQLAFPVERIILGINNFSIRHTTRCGHVYLLDVNLYYDEFIFLDEDSKRANAHLIFRDDTLTIPYSIEYPVLHKATLSLFDQLKDFATQFNWFIKGEERYSHQFMEYFVARCIASTSKKEFLSWFKRLDKMHRMLPLEIGRQKGYVDP